MQIGPRAVRPQFQKLDPFKTQADYGTFLGVFVTFVPDASSRSQHLGMFIGEPVKTGIAHAVRTINKKPQRHRKFPESLLVRFDRSQARHQIAFAIGSATREELAIDDRCGKWSNGPLAQMTNGLNIVVTVNDVTLRTAATLAVDNWIARADPK